MTISNKKRSIIYHNFSRAFHTPHKNRFYAGIRMYLSGETLVNVPRIQGVFCSILQKSRKKYSAIWNCKKCPKRSMRQRVCFFQKMQGFACHYSKIGKNLILHFCFKNSIIWYKEPAKRFGLIVPNNGTAAFFAAMLSKLHCRLVIWANCASKARKLCCQNTLLGGTQRYGYSLFVQPAGF